MFSEASLPLSSILTGDSATAELSPVTYEQRQSDKESQNISSWRTRWRTVITLTLDPSEPPLAALGLAQLRALCWLQPRPRYRAAIRLT